VSSIVGSLEHMPITPPDRLLPEDLAVTIP
jgi:hypothetical protein